MDFSWNPLALSARPRGLLAAWVAAVALRLAGGERHSSALPLATDALPTIPCFDVNTAPFHTLVRVNGLGTFRAQLISKGLFCPFEDAVDFQTRFAAAGGNWALLKQLLDSGALCVKDKPQGSKCLEVNGASKWQLAKAGVEEEAAKKVVVVRRCPYAGVADMEAKIKAQLQGTKLKIFHWGAIKKLIDDDEICAPSAIASSGPSVVVDKGVEGAEDEEKVVVQRTGPLTLPAEELGKQVDGLELQVDGTPAAWNTNGKGELLWAAPRSSLIVTIRHVKDGRDVLGHHFFFVADGLKFEDSGKFEWFCRDWPQLVISGHLGGDKMVESLAAEARK